MNTETMIQQEMVAAVETVQPVVIDIEAHMPVSPKALEAAARYGEHATDEDMQLAVAERAVDVAPTAHRKLPGHDFTRMMGPA